MYEFYKYKLLYNICIYYYTSQNGVLGLRFWWDSPSNPSKATTRKTGLYEIGHSPRSRRSGELFGSSLLLLAEVDIGLGGRARPQDLVLFALPHVAVQRALVHEAVYAAAADEELHGLFFLLLVLLEGAPLIRLALSGLHGMPTQPLIVVPVLGLLLQLWTPILYIKD